MTSVNKTPHNNINNVPKNKLLEETAKVDKVFSKFKTYSITKTNELLYAGSLEKGTIVEEKVAKQD